MLVKSPTSSSSSSEYLFYSCPSSTPTEIAKENDHHIERGIEMTEDSEMSKPLLGNADLTGTIKEVTASQQAAQADWKQREVSTRQHEMDHVMFVLEKCFGILESAT